MPTKPADTVLFIIGPATVDDAYLADYKKSAGQLRALGYNVIDPTDHPADKHAELLAKSHGMATTERFDDPVAGDNMRLLQLGHALGKPELSVIGWAKGTATNAADWYPELFDGAL